MFSTIKKYPVLLFIILMFIIATNTVFAATVLSTHPANGATDVPAYLPLSVRLDQSVNLSTVSFTLSPSVPGALSTASCTILSYDSNATYSTSTCYRLVFTPATNLLRNTNYTAAISGGGLSAPYSWNFTTGNLYSTGEVELKKYASPARRKPAVAMNEYGFFVTAWQNTDGIYAQSFYQDGSPAGSAVQVGAGNYSVWHGPSVAMNSAGDIVVAWMEDIVYSDHDKTYQIYVAKYPIGGNAFTITITYTYANAIDDPKVFIIGGPSVGIDDSGRFVVVYQAPAADGNGPADRQVYGHLFDAGGKLIKTLGDASLTKPNGNKCTKSDVPSVSHTAYCTDYSNVSNENPGCYPTMDMAYYPAVAMASNGKFVVTWMAWRGAYSCGWDDVVAKIFDSNGKVIKNNFTVNTFQGGTYDQWISYPAINNNGDIVIVWASRYQGEDGAGIFGRLYNFDGSPKTGEFRINTYKNDDQWGPSVGIDPGGNFTVAWESNGQDCGGHGVYARQYNTSGVPLGPEFRVNTYNSLRLDTEERVYHDQCEQLWPERPGISITPYGDLVVAWASFDYEKSGSPGYSGIASDGYGYGIYANIYSNSVYAYDDFDNIPPQRDNCPYFYNPSQADTDGDGVGDECDNCMYFSNSNQSDADNDGVGDICDNCPAIFNSDQKDIDEDSTGDACDTDDDNDGRLDSADNCPFVYNPDQSDSDGDGVGNACDNCPSVSNANQADTDGNGVGDICNTDDDSDAIADADDNCPSSYNPDQMDTDNDGIGDQCEWTIECADCSKYFSEIYLSSRYIDLDSNSRPHIAYGGDHLYYAYFNGTIWKYEVVDNAPGVGKFASLALDSNNKAHISYSDYPNYALKYATNASGVWVITTVDSGIGEGGYISMAIDSNNKAHISYGDGYNQDLKYATNASGSWVATLVDTGSATETSIAIDSNNKVHISYNGDGNTDLKYATNSSGSWVTKVVDKPTGGPGGFDTSISVDRNNKVHISYNSGMTGTGSTDPGSYNLKYATNASGSWVKSTIDSAGAVGYDTSIAVDSNNKVHISYQDNTNANLKYATNISGSWVLSTLESTGSTGYATSIALDSKNKVHITYLDLTYKAPNSLKYRTNASGSWVVTVVEYRNVSYQGFEDISIALDRNNKVHISYYDNESLKYATNVSGNWVSTKIDSSSSWVGGNSSIAVDSNNKVHISYQDGYNDDLKYATNKSGSWIVTTLVSTGYSGYNTSISLDSNNKVYIAYGEYNSGYALKYITNASGSWVSTTVDTGISLGGIGSAISLKIDSNNKLHIAYQKDVNSFTDGLKYATNATVSWVITTLDSGQYVGWDLSLDLDSGNKAHISYTGGGLDLRYITNVSGSWVKTVLDYRPSRYLYDTSVSVDSNDKVHISYYDDGINKDLKYATNKSGSWAISVVDYPGDVGGFSSIATDSNGKVHISYYDESNLDVKYAMSDLPDKDHDGMPDSFELRYGLDPNNPLDASYDRDGDGLSNLQEYLKGTNPLFAESESIGMSRLSASSSASALTLNDGVPDGIDNCPLTYNPDQRDTDGDGIGDACDPDTDSDADGITDMNDMCPFVKPVRVGSAYYSSLQTGYDNTVNGGVLQSQDLSLAGDLNLNQPKSVILSAGYDCYYTDNTGVTKLTGNMRVTGGSVRISNGHLNIK